MKGFLLDTNIPSELSRLRADPKVVKWIDDADDEQLFLSVVSIGERLNSTLRSPVRPKTCTG
jgi:toxin FitB